MTADARWVANVTASALHAARAQLREGEAARGPLVAALREATEQLGSDLATIGIEPERFFAHAIPLSTRFDAPRKWAEVSLHKALGRPAAEAAAQQIARRQVALVAALQTAVPDPVHEIELRSGPLREQWEARAPGLLTELRRLTETEAVVELAEVILVQPIQGGGGDSYPAYNSLDFEAVLTNPLAELPEIVRLGWLWGQLAFDLPRYQDQLGRDRLLAIGRLALVPPVLASAAEVELARCDRAMLSTACSAWRIAPAPVDTLLDWWETYTASSTAWSVALVALDRMLAAESL